MTGERETMPVTAGLDPVFATARAALAEADPAAKCARVARLELPAGWTLSPSDLAALPATPPGRPGKPALVHPRDVATRGLGTLEGRAALVHAVAHIEFNAINLGLDALTRFPGMPAGYYADWLSVAADEARHFAMMRDRLVEMGFDYGAFPAHNGLWEAAEKTAHDCLARMACVPRVLEARGLDVTPGMIQRLKSVGDRQTVSLLDTILAEEVRHVAIGTHWFRYLCDLWGLDPVPTFAALLAEHGMVQYPPFNDHARRAAGFAPGEWPETATT